MVPLLRRLRPAAVVMFCLCSLVRAERVTLDLSGPGWFLWLDQKAAWESDRLYFPTPPLKQLPVNPPTGGWPVLDAAQATPVSVPGTVEEYLQTKSGPAGDLLGVSWWWRAIDLPTSATGRRVLLRFDAVRLRAEVFVNHQLVGYDLVGNSPFEVDVTDHVTPGKRCEIAVRVTDPAGNFDWRDSQPMRWGQYLLPVSHGFGGIPGDVRLIICDPVYVDDLYVQNTPAISVANAIVTVRNSSSTSVSRNLLVRVSERSAPEHVVFETVQRDVALPPGSHQLSVKMEVPAARAWDLEHPDLYICTTTLQENGQSTDTDRRTFGFRWFSPDGIGRDAVLRLNGRRIVLRTAISWGFWPINGLYPTSDWAEKQIRTAKAFGLNMLNFHRAIGQPIVLDRADELGLLYYEEPGAHKSADHDAFAQQLAREKLLRMVRRDRSHPALVIYTLINEWDSRNPHPNPVEIARHRDDMAAAHELDPSRLILHTSAWARAPEIDDPAKLHFRPFDSKPYLSGWYDVHHAGGPATWNESLYRTPRDFYGRTENTREVVFWGEEGAISTPPRLALIAAELKTKPRLGWDGAMYLDWYETFASFLARKHLQPDFADVDALTSALGAVSLGHQGRRIENMRMSNVGDGYAINGWEAEIVENHSGVVDCFRNPKSDPVILAYYNQPLYVAVKLRNMVLQPPGSLVADLYLINERDVRGPHQLEVSVRDAQNRELSHATRSVVVTGGETYGELLVEGLTLPLAADANGQLRVEARLLNANGAALAEGHDEAVAVDWRSEQIRGSGAVWESDGRLAHFLTKTKGLTAPDFTPGLGHLDWVAVSRGPNEGEPTPIPSTQLSLSGAAGSGPGVQVAFFRDGQFRERLLERNDPNVAYSVDDGAAPDPSLSTMTNYGVRWTGRLSVPHSGTYTFVVHSTGAVRFAVGGRTLFDRDPARTAETTRGTLTLSEGSTDIILELRQGRGIARCELNWITPEKDPSLAPALLERVRRDGTTLVIVDRAEAWMPLVTGAPNPGVTYSGSFRVGKTWLGGIHFVRDHPLFAGLPTKTAMDWPYQAVVRNGEERLGLRLEGEDLAAGCYHSYPMELGTAVGVIRFGRGAIVFSTLDLTANLDADDGPAIVGRKLLQNFLNYRAGR